MRPPILLKTILDICFIFSAFSLVVFLISLIITFSTGTDLFVSIEKPPEDLNNFALWGLILIEVIKTFAFVYGLYVLRKLIRSFFGNKLYTKLQIASLNLSGRLICLSVILGAVSEFFKKMIVDSRIELNFGLEFSFSSFWIILAFGIFLIFLSKVFTNARQLKQENELTI
ncbi:DUF2975 domain-containing protein [Zunongwangia atlantica]|uniref:DUF2975 domain-containing protein n=1 Tax=Zunongwangia atlantica 22II14-10F7 TaxID=1185767 RepID=A0A1Y1T4S8_9FLAO|nr:DUF2975 domain-containing protein [Zunongwangia atlantica]ORL46050.1 hypothetical protein IIF7_08016 [Zunongwangia atlantica 22II14-10F7]